MDNNDFYYEDVHPKKAIILFIIFILIVLVGVGFFIFIREKNILSLKTVIYEAGDKISYNVKDYIKSTIVDEDDYSLLFNGVTLNGDILDTVGEYKYRVKYKNITKTGKIKVVDTTPPIVEIKECTIGVDEVLLLDDFIASAEDYSKPLNVEYKTGADEQKIKSVGTHDLEIVISDRVGNKITKMVKLTVKENYNSSTIKKNDLVIHHTDLGYEIKESDLIVKYNEALFDDEELDGDDEYAKVIEMLTSEKSDLHSYLPEAYYNNLITETDLVYAYNQYNYIVGLALRVKLDNGQIFYLKNNN